MKKAIFALCIVSLVLLVSCQTSGFMLNEEDTIPNVEQKGTVETDDYKIVASGNFSNGVLAQSIRVQVSNKSLSPIIIDLNKSAYVEIGSSKRMIDGNTRVMNSNLSQPLYTVAPKSSMTRELYDPEQVGFIGNATLNPTLNSRLSLCLTIEGKDIFSDVVLERETLQVQREKIGEVSFKLTKFHIFFLGNTRKAVLEKAKEEAVKKFGEGVGIENIRYEGGWNIASMLLYFSMLGWVESVEATADVVK